MGPSQSKNKSIKNNNNNRDSTENNSDTKQKQEEVETDGWDHKTFKKNTMPVTYHWEYGGKEVYLSGSFNDWKSKVPMIFSGGKFTTTIELPSGTHEFKYLVDGNWLHDPNQETVDDNFNGLNNIMTVNDPCVKF